MRRLALRVLLLVVSVACSRQESLESHGDPPCAFDETGCLPADLLLTVEAREEGPRAVLRATSPLEGNSWVQEGIRGSVDWRLPDGTKLDEEQGLGEVGLQGTPGAVAGRVQLSLESDADQVSVQIAFEGGDDPGSGLFQEIPIGADPAVLSLEHGIHVLRLQASWPQGEAVFFFTVRRR